MMSIIVVLPAPFGPMMARISPGSMVERQVVERPEAVEGDVDAVEIEHADVVFGSSHGSLRSLGFARRRDGRAVRFGQ